MTFTPRFVMGDLDLTDWPFSVYYGADLGAPENMAQVVDSMLADGDLELSRRKGNRTMALSVLIEEADLAAIAEAEALLELEADKDYNTLAITPGDGIGATSVYEIFRHVPAFVHDDEMEWQGFRRYDLSFRALPFARAESETTIDALAVGAGSETTISDGTSATGWTSPDGSVTVSSGALLIPGPATYDSVNVGDDGLYYMQAETEATLTTSAINFSTTPFFYFDYSIPTSSPSGTSVEVAAAEVDSVSLNLVADYSVSSQVRRAVFYCTDSSATLLRFVFTVRRAASTASITTTVQLDDVKRSGRSPKASSTGRSSIRTLDIEGSARTQVSMKVGHASSGLGDTIVFTGPRVGRGYSPDLFQYKGAAQGGETTDAATLTGKWTTIAAAKWFAIPAASLPAGGFSLWGRLKAGSSINTAVTWTATTTVNSVNVGPTLTSTVPTSLTTSGKLFHLGSMTLPATPVSPGSAGTVYLTLQSGVSGDGVAFDELWLFAKGDDYALTIIEAGSGSPSFGTVHNYAWIDSPSLTWPMPAVWVGTDSTKSDVLGGASFARRAGLHLFPPGLNGVYLATVGAADASLSARYFRRANTHVV